MSPPEPQRRSSSSLPPVAVFLVVIAALYFARQILIPLAIAVLLGFLLTPAVRRLESWRLPRVPAVLIVALLSLAAVASVGWTVTSQLIQVIVELPQYRSNIERKIDSLRGHSGGALSRATASVEELSKELSSGPKKEPVLPREPARSQKAAPPPETPRPPTPVEIVEPPPTAIQSIRNLLSPLLAPLETAGIVIIFAIVILIRREDLRNRLLRLAGVDQLTLVTKAFDDASNRISSYLRMQFLVNASFAGLLTAGLYVIGVPAALLWGVLAGIARFVPYVGPIFGGSMPIIVAIAVSPGWTTPLLVTGLFVLIELITAYAIEPWLYGSHTGISSLAILVSATFWTAIWGPVGLVVSTPLTACLVVLGRHVPKLEFLYVLLGDEPVLSDDLQLYQRLLAADRQEAQAAIDKYAAAMPPVQLYDSVIVPALARAEEDRHRGVLEESNEAFIAQIVSEFIEKLSPFSEEPLPSDHLPDLLAHQLSESATRAICIPAADKADELVAAMLGNLLQTAGIPAVCLPVDADAAVLEALAPQRGDIICVSALPPFALWSARSFTRKLRQKSREVPIIVGLWGTSDESAEYRDRLRKALDVEVVTNLGEAVDAMTRIRNRAQRVSGRRDALIEH
jgi:predicted PurR-regulated permease PerM